MQPINQFGSFASFFAQLGSGTSAQPFKTVKDYDNWLKRARRVAGHRSTPPSPTCAKASRKGSCSRKVLMEKVLPQLDALIVDKPEDTHLLGADQKLPGDLHRRRQDAAHRRLSRPRSREQLVPAYKRLHDFIARRIPAGRARHGRRSSALPDGEAWYAYQVRKSTTTTT